MDLYMIRSRLPCDWVCYKMRFYGMRHNMNLFATYTYGPKYDTFKYKHIRG